MTTFGNALSLRVDGAIGAMSLSPNGRDAVLAGRKGLFVIDLDDPFTPPRWLHHITSWEVADVQWLPHHHVKPSWCVSTLNQKALLWDLARPLNNAIQLVLHRHTRAITDIHFHPQDPELLATCLIDTFVFAWDMRLPRRPAAKYAQWRAGATQVKWNLSNPHQLALSHHHSFLVWDQRMGAKPLWRIDNAHKGKINGLDFSGLCDRLITCANDKTVKFWDVRDSKALSAAAPKPTIVIHTDYPVARARRLPFGRDNCCGIMPVRGGDNSVHIVNYKAEYGRARSLGETVHMDAIADYSFRGHAGPVKDFLWRKQHENYAHAATSRGWKEYQLVTWLALDGDLRLWPHAQKVYDTANYNPQHQVLLALVGGVGADEFLALPALPVPLTPLASTVGTPEVEYSEDAALDSALPVDYRSFVGEPETSFADYVKDAAGDFLSKLAGYTIKTRLRAHRTTSGAARASQVNHLSWISGVRMGRASDKSGADFAGDDQDEGPANLGEEISIVGHKFSKVRFEKISVSTGQIEILMRGPLPNVALEPAEADALALSKSREKRDSVSEKSNSASAGAPSPGPVSAPTGGATSGAGADSANVTTNTNNTSGNGVNGNANNAGAASGAAASTAGQNIPHTPSVGGVRPNTAIPTAIPTTPAAPAVPAANTNANTNANAANVSISNATITASSAGGAANISVSNSNAATAAASPTDLQEQKLIFIRLEIKFPKHYPFLEPLASKHSSSRKRLLHKKANQIRFDIEETHELTAAVKSEMLRNLDEIAEFYANKYHKFCLEPCLRYLMGDKIDLEDALMVNTEDDDNHDADSHMEVGNENWVDDLIDQHEAAAAFARMSVSADEEDDDDADLIFGNNDKLAASQDLGLQRGDGEDADGKFPKSASGSAESKIKHDSTPLPKGCGAVWTRSGELVCFFIPKNDHDVAKPQHKSGGFKFADTGFGLRSKESKQEVGGENKPAAETAEKSTNKGVYVPNDTDSESDADGHADSEDDTFSTHSHSSNSSDDSFANDWDEMLQDDIPSGARMPGMFRDTVAVGRRIRLGETHHHARGTDGKSSVYKASGADDSALKSTRKAKKGKRGKSVVSIIDFRHLVPDKYELAREYRVLGDAPEVIARHNSDVAFRYGYTEIGRVWRIVEMLLVKEVRLRDLNEVGKDFFHENRGSSHDFFWGNHPLGHAWMVGQLFRHFEEKQDLQMLAMLSCLLYENLLNFAAKGEQNLDVPLHTPYPSLPPRPSIMSMRENGLLSSDEVLAGNGSYKSARSASTDHRKSISRKPSVLSSRDTHFSRPFSPEFMQSFLGAAAMSNESQSRGLSLTPSLKFPYTQSGSYNFASPTFTDSFSLKAVERNSRSFENLNIFARLLSGARNGSRSGKNIAYKGKNMGVPSSQRERMRPPPNFTIEMKNVDLLDLYEDRFSAPLLAGVDLGKLVEYREQYAEMLYLWGLPLHRIKILKFNYLKGATHAASEADYDVHKCLFGSRSRRAFTSKQLLLTPTTPIRSAKNNAWNTAKRDALKYCGYCGLIVSKRVVICTKCEHIVHPHCAEEWWAKDDSGGLGVVDECATGCGCECLVTEL